MIDRFGTRDTPLGAMVAVVAMAAAGRKIVWNTSREPHLGQRSFVSATTGRTYARKRSDQITAKNPCKEGVVHICAKTGADSGRRFRLNGFGSDNLLLLSECFDAALLCQSTGRRSLLMGSKEPNNSYLLLDALQ